MKYRFEVELDQECYSDLKCYFHAPDIQSAIWEFGAWLREQDRKVDHANDAVYDKVDQIRSEFHDYFGRYLD